jgi:glycosyltransferase involved in cell wall biosynthesis
MRILFISTSFPTDLHINVNGKFQRMRMFIEAIKEIAPLDMLFYVPSATDVSPSAVSQLERSFSQYWDADLHLSLCPRFDYPKRFSKWQLYGAGAFNFFRQPGYVDTSGPQQVQAFEACLEQKPEVIFAHRLASMCPPLLTRKRLPPIFFDLDDIEHVAFLRSIDRQSGWRTKLVYYSRIPELWWGERRAIRLAQRTFVCSELDRDYLTNRWRLPGIVTVPNAISSATLLPVAPEPTLLFLGSYRYKPNVQAAEFLLEQIWPRVFQVMPEARLIIAGASPEGIRGYDVGIPGVEFADFVDNLDELYRRSRVVCAPILSGAGTRVKIIEAAAYGKPIVATRLGAEGLEMCDGEELFLHDDPASFADACLKLLRDCTLCERLGAAARATAIQCYNRSNIVRKIQNILKMNVM